MPENGRPLLIPLEHLSVTPDELQYAPSDLSDIAANPKSHLTAYGEQDDNGVDISLIRSNMRLTPLERVVCGQRAAFQAREIKVYGQRRIR